MKKIIYAILMSISLSLTGCSFIEQGIQKWEDNSKQKEIDEIVSQVEDIIPNFQKRYFLSQLKNEDLAFVALAYQGLMNFEDEIEINLEFEDENRPFQLLELLQYDCPELYQFSTNSTTSTVTMNWIERNKQIVNFHVDYILTPEEYTNSRQTIEDTIYNIVAQANEYFESQMDKELYVYDYITSNTIYNENATHNSSTYGVLIDGQAACLGISRTFEWILNELDIPCITIGGYTQDLETGHAWNIVKLDGEYYSVDLTSDTIQIDKDNYKLYLYYNVTDAEVRSKYELTDSLFNVPETNGDYYNYFNYFNLVASDYQEAYELISNKIYNLFMQGYGEFNIKIKDTQAYNDILNNISSIYNECRTNYGVSGYQASYANSDEYQIIHFQIN